MGGPVTCLPGARKGTGKGSVTGVQRELGPCSRAPLLRSQEPRGTAPSRAMSRYEESLEMSTPTSLSSHPPL